MNFIKFGMAALLFAAFWPASAQAAATVNKGDTAWMLTATAFVVLMTIPGLALFYGGLVRSKNVLSVLMQVLVVFSIISILWVLYGYSLAFTGNASAGLNPFIGGFSKAFLAGVGTTSEIGTFSKETNIPELAFVIFQMTFACITPALIVGAFAERMKFSAVLLFMVIWFTFAYLPMAHMVWFWAGPDAYTLSADNLAVRLEYDRFGLVAYAADRCANRSGAVKADVQRTIAGMSKRTKLPAAIAGD